MIDTGITYNVFSVTELTSWNLFSSLFMILIRRTSFSALSSLKMQFRSSPKPCRRKKKSVIWGKTALFLVENISVDTTHLR